MTAIERLEEQLDAKDAEIRRLEDEIRETQDQLKSTESGWSLPEDLPKEQTLPVPRLEMLFFPHPDGWDECEMVYRLVYRHLLGHCVAVPFGSTTRKGGRAREPWDIRNPGKLDLPYRDGVHIRHDAFTLKLPAFAVFGEHVDTLEPLERKPHA